MTAPKHGTISTGVSKQVFTGTGFRNRTNCKGKMLPRINIYYKPRSGFTGSDFVRINSYKPGKPLENEIINVRISVTR